MSKFALLIFFALPFLASCGKLPDFGMDRIESSERYFSSREAHFDPFVTEFVQSCSQRLHPDFCSRVESLPINFAPQSLILDIARRHGLSDPKSILGLCLSNGKRSEILILDSERTRSFDRETMRTLVWHEIGHSHHFNKPHEDLLAGYHDIASPASIMNPSLFQASFIWDAYVEQFFMSDNQAVKNALKSGYSGFESSQVRHPFIRENLAVDAHSLTIFQGDKVFSYSFDYAGGEDGHGNAVSFEIRENGSLIQAGNISYNQIKFNYQEQKIETPHVLAAP